MLVFGFFICLDLVCWGVSGGWELSEVGSVVVGFLVSVIWGFAGKMFWKEGLSVFSR